MTRTEFRERYLNNILVTCPGKLGDLFYSLPLIIQIKKKFNCNLVYATSSYCEPAISLLKVQPYIKDSYVDQNYTLNNTLFGGQPWKMSEPSDYDAIFHLGLRKEFVLDVLFKQHLIRTFFLNFYHGYGIKLNEKNINFPYIFLKKGNINKNKKDYIIFHGFRKEWLEKCDIDFQERYKNFFNKFFNIIGEKVIVIKGKDECKNFNFLDTEVIYPSNFLETAKLINNALCFVGVASAAAAVANGIKSPRLILKLYGNAYPTGQLGALFSIKESVNDVVNKFIEVLV